MSNFIGAAQAKSLTAAAQIDILTFKKWLAQFIEDNAKQGNTCVMTIAPTYLNLGDLEALIEELQQLGYKIEFDKSEAWYSLNVCWND